jgi:hypothetical protein
MLKEIGLESSLVHPLIFITMLLPKKTTLEEGYGGVGCIEFIS